MTSSDDLHLYELFVRYWDNTLDCAEREELEQLLAAEPQTREWFQLFTMQAVAAAEHPAPAGLPGEVMSEIPSPLQVSPEITPCEVSSAAPIIQQEKKRRWTRRQALQYFGGGLATGLAGVALGRWLLNDDPLVGPRLWNVQGTVLVQDSSGKAVSANAHVPAGGTISTYGMASSVVLAYPDGSKITLTGDSAVRVAEENRRLILHRGAISAEIPSLAAGFTPVDLATSQVVFAGLSGVTMTVGEGLRATEALVHQGTAEATHPTGEPLVVVREGESLTVWSDGDHKKNPIPATPEVFSWDLSQPPAEVCAVGQLGTMPDGQPVACPEFWPDPYYQYTEMYQIRSNKRWLHGFFQVHPDSSIRIRYWVDTPGAGQFCFCSRTTQTRSPETGMLEWSGVLGESGAGRWHWLEIKAKDMLGPPNKHSPKFGSPWVGFLFLFNTYTKDLGLRIAELRVTRPGAANPGR